MEDDDYSSPQRGTRVDSINYYKNQLDDLNCKVEIMQQEKRRVMEEGNDRVSASEWISNIYRMTSGAVRKRSSTTNGLLVGFQDKVSTHSPSVFKQVSIDFFFGGLQFLNRNIGKIVLFLEIGMTQTYLFTHDSYSMLYHYRCCCGISKQVNIVFNGVCDIY